MDELRNTRWDLLQREVERRFTELSTNRNAQLPPEANMFVFPPRVQSVAALSDLDRLSPLPPSSGFHPPFRTSARLAQLTRPRIGTMKHSKAEFDKAKAAAAKAGPCVFEKILSWEDWKVPVFFTCTSGVLLWGQLHSTMEGYMGKELDTALGLYHTMKPGVDNHGTILQHCFRYRAPARKGLWKVEAAYGRGATRPLGYVCHHVDVDGVDIVRISLQNDHADNDIVYINRYDWARWGCGQGYQVMAELLKPKVKKMLKGTKPKPEGNKKSKGKKPKAEDEDDWDEYKEALVANRLMLVDAQGFPQLVQSLRDGVKLEAKNYLFRDNKKGIAKSAPPAPPSQQPSSSSDAFGVNLGVGDHDNELGWMAFQNGKLVGFVYNGVYCDLDLKFFRLGDTEFEVPREPTPEFEESGESGNDSADNSECSRSTKYTTLLVFPHANPRFCNKLCYFNLPFRSHHKQKS